jgi:hypothetical protein
MTGDLIKILDLLSELVDQVSYNASADDLQSFPMRTRQIERADQLRIKIKEFRGKLSEAKKS